jgi:hypothetical protein
MMLHCAFDRDCASSSCSFIPVLLDWCSMQVLSRERASNGACTKHVHHLRIDRSTSMDPLSPHLHSSTRATLSGLLGSYGGGAPSIAGAPYALPMSLDACHSFILIRCCMFACVDTCHSFTSLALIRCCIFARIFVALLRRERT